MRIQHLLIVCAAALGGSTSPSYAGPCSQEIARLQAELDATLNSNAATGPSARESTAATMHRQPTPESMAAAEVPLGEEPPERVRAINAAVARAIEADTVGNQSACEQALADVHHIRAQ